MIRIGIIKTILSEYGLTWAVNREMYNLKLKLLNGIPFAERWFEPSNIAVKRLDIFTPDTEAIGNFLKGMGEQEKKELIRNADLAAKGKIKAFSSLVLDYGQPIRWNYNPVTGKTVSLNKKWYKISDFDKETGDIKTIWEASRFSHFYLFSRAYLLTGDRKYYEAYHSQLTDWVKENKYSYGPNYKCGQECSLRLVNSLINYAVFQREGLITAEDEKAIKQIVENSYRKIISNFFYAYKCIQNNHTISELLGMVIGSWCCQDEKRLKYAYEKLEEVIGKQFFCDGGYRQFSFNYQRLALQDIECLISISNKTGRELSAESKDRVLKSAYMLYQLQNKEGDVPNYGPNDGALIFPVTSCGYRDFRPVVQCISTMVANKRVYLPGLYDEELIWFTGREWEKMPVQVQLKTSKAYEEAGIYQFQADNSRLVIVLNNFHTRPAHYDQLHLDLWVGDKNVLCDSGTYSYADEKGLFLAGTDAHNTLKISGREQMKQHGPFFVYDWTKRKSVQMNEHSFEGSIESSNGYCHSRRIEIQKAEGIVQYVVFDRINCSGTEEYEIVFHTPYEAVQVEDGVEIYDAGEKLCLIKGSCPVVTKCKRSLYYMRATDMFRIGFCGRIESNEAESKIIIEAKG